jgi:hypothetical protein
MESQSRLLPETNDSNVDIFDLKNDLRDFMPKNRVRTQHWHM